MNGDAITRLPAAGRKPEVEERVHEILEPMLARHSRAVRTKALWACAVVVAVATALNLWYCHY